MCADYINDVLYFGQICSVIESHLLVKLNTTVTTDKVSKLNCNNICNYSMNRIVTSERV